jgi:hypothetical protein
MKLFLFSVIIACLSMNAMGGDYIVVVNKASSLSSASPADLKRLYTGKVSDIGGTKVAPANLGLDNPAAASFLKEVVGMAESDYKSFWLAQQIRGGSSAPAVRKTADAMLEFVSTTDNAIGYVPTGTPTDNVKALTVK